jgi:DnaJ-class molecular chaperone
VTDRLDELDYYTLLGVAPQANVDEVRVAFH